MVEMGDEHQIRFRVLYFNNFISNITQMRQIETKLDFGLVFTRKPLIRLGANMPARAERVARRSDFDQYTPGSGETYEVVLYFGIIDILQDYDISKKLEHAYKSLQADPTSISAVDPKLYSKRFRDFVGRIFVEDR